MGPWPGEQQRLTEIENQLRRSDPGLAAMLARFTAEDRQERPVPSCQRGRPPKRRSPAQMLFLIAAAVTLIITCVVMAVTAASRGGRPSHGHGQGTSPAVSVYSPVG